MQFDKYEVRYRKHDNKVNLWAHFTDYSGAFDNISMNWIVIGVYETKGEANAAKSAYKEKVAELKKAA